MSAFELFSISSALSLEIIFVMKETNIWPQVITKIGKILDFGLEYGKQFGKWAAGFTAFN